MRENLILLVIIFGFNQDALIAETYSSDILGKIEVFYNNEPSTQSKDIYPREDSFKSRAKWDEEHGIQFKGGSVEGTLYPKPMPIEDDDGLIQGDIGNPLAPADSDIIFENDEN